MNKTILIVDDNEGDRVAMKEILDAEIPSVDILLAESGEDAVVQAKDNNPDIVILDTKLGGMDGFEACRRIVESDPETKVVFVTGHEVNQCARQALIAGAFSLLNKPVDPEHMIALVEYLVKSPDDAVLDLIDRVA